LKRERREGPAPRIHGWQVTRFRGWRELRQRAGLTPALGSVWHHPSCHTPARFRRAATLAGGRDPLRGWSV